MSKSVRYIDREISWLKFNERVLQEANDPSVPLIERIKFLGIFSNNQDEFFRTRVGSLKQSMKNAVDLSDECLFSPKETLKHLGVLVHQLRTTFEDTFQRLVEELKLHNVLLVNEQRLSAAHKHFAIDYFRNQLRSHLFPLDLKKVKDHTYLNERSIYLFVKICSSKVRARSDYFILEMPTDKFSRFLVLPPEKSKEYVMMLDDVIRLGFPDIFLPIGYDTYDAYTFKLTRNAEVPVDTEGETLEIVKDILRLREKSDVVRFLYDRSMPKEMLQYLLKALKIGKDVDIDTGSRYHNSKDFLKFPSHFCGGKLLYKPHKVLGLSTIPIHANMLDLVRRKDRLLHFPYQSFQMMIDFLRESSLDPKVDSIKMTIYRVAEDSSILNALVNAVRNGKKVSVYVEVKARFDEENNLNWVERLQDEGVKVLRVLPDYKVHAKMLLVTTVEQKKKRLYAAIGTGNPNEETALVYTDKLLFTANPAVTVEVEKVFDMIENRLSFPNFETLLVAPINLRQRFMEMIDFEIAQAQQGKKAWITFKLNSLADKGIIDKLYEAAHCGVQIRLLIRGLCVLNAVLPEANGNIVAFSIVDRFLEHARVYAFCNADDPRYYMGSADFVKQKMDKRIEVVIPLLDKDLQQEVQDIVDIQFTDNTHARWLDPKRLNTYVRSEKGRSSRRAQQLIYEYLRKKS